MVVVVGAQVVFVVELARVAFVADGAVEETHGGGEGVVAWWHRECVYGSLAGMIKGVCLDSPRDAEEMGCAVCPTRLTERRREECRDNSLVLRLHRIASAQHRPTPSHHESTSL